MSSTTNASYPKVNRHSDGWSSKVNTDSATMIHIGDGYYIKTADRAHRNGWAIMPDKSNVHPANMVHIGNGFWIEQVKKVQMAKEWQTMLKGHPARPARPVRVVQPSLATTLVVPGQTWSSMIKDGAANVSLPMLKLRFRIEFQLTECPGSSCRSTSSHATRTFC